MNKYLEIIILHVCCLLLRAYSLFIRVPNCDVVSTDIEELTWQHKDMNVHRGFWLYMYFHLDNSFCHAQLHSVPGTVHSRPQRPRSFWSAPRIATSGLVQRHSAFEWLCKRNRLRPEPIRFVKLDSEHAQSDGKSVNRGLPVLDLARGRDSWC